MQMEDNDIFNSFKIVDEKMKKVTELENVIKGIQDKNKNLPKPDPQKEPSQC